LSKWIQISHQQALKGKLTQNFLVKDTPSFLIASNFPSIALFARSEMCKLFGLHEQFLDNYRRPTHPLSAQPQPEACNQTVN